MKGYTIQHSIELLEKNVGSGSGGASTAAQVSFDNTGTGLVATNVQTAIGELDGRDNYSTSEAIIGKWIDGRPIYRKVIDFGALPNNTHKEVAHNIADLDLVIKLYGCAKAPNAFAVLPYVTVEDGNYQIALEITATDVVVWTDYDRSAYSGHVVVEYLKTAPAASEAKSTRKKSSK